jgi:arginine deiminase
LASLGVEVLQLADFVALHRPLLRRLPNLAYLHDVAVIHSRGAILSRMAWPGRSGEEVVVREALERLGVPLLWECDGVGGFEGCLLLSPQTVFVAETERHSPAAVERFVSCALEHVPEVVVAEVPQARRYMHPDTVLGRVSERLMLGYPAALRRTWLLTRQDGHVRRREIDLPRWLAERGVELVAVTDAEQRRLACTFVALEPGVILHYAHALSTGTRRRLERRGVELIPFEADALLAGGGSLRCITLRLHRGASRTG